MLGFKSFLDLTKILQRGVYIEDHKSQKLISPQLRYSSRFIRIAPQSLETCPRTYVHFNKKVEAIYMRLQFSLD